MQYALLLLLPLPRAQKEGRALQERIIHVDHMHRYMLIRVHLNTQCVCPATS